MLCPRPILSPTNIETIKRFLLEMRAIDFRSLSAGVCHSTPPSYIPSDLRSCSHVWMRIDRVRRSLEAPYSGPHAVVNRFPKYFTLDLPRGITSVSIDRLKPAYIRTPDPDNSPVPEGCSR